MGQKKKNKIILISIIIVVILTLFIGITYAFLATDLLKSNKDLFFKYITQINDEKQGFIETSLKQYFQKQKNTPYLDEGSVSVNITSANNQEQFNPTNAMNITFDGQVDVVNSQAMQNICLNYSEQVKFPIAYKKIGDTMGIQTDYIGNKYITTSLKGLDSITEQDTKNLEKVQEVTNVQFSEEDIQYLKETYLNICNQQLQDSNFSKIEEANSKGYKLTLTGETFKNLIIQLLETLKNDQRTLDKINEYIKIQKNSSKITASNIDNLIKDINNNTELEKQNLEITVYQSKGKITGIVIKINESALKLEKTVTANDLQYNIELQINQNKQTGKIGLISRFAGLQAMQNITENYELTLEMEDMKYQYNYNNNVEFTQSTDIEAFNDENSLLLDNMNEEEKSNFLKAVMERIQSINQKQMQELGVEETQNPLIYSIPQITINTSNLNTSEVSEIEVNAFNNKFENYESTNLKGVTVKGLLSTIQLNNESQENENRKIKEIHFDGEEYETNEQNITFIKTSIETETAYRVEFERDEDTGVIYRAVINKK